MENLKELYMCEKVSKIPELSQSLKYLNCEGCTGLIFVPDSALEHICSKALRTIINNYLKWRLKQVMDCVSSNTGIIYNKVLIDKDVASFPRGRLL